MKIVIKIIFLILFFYVSFAPPAQGQSNNSNSFSEPVPAYAGASQDSKTGDNELNINEYENTGMQEDDIFSYEEDFLTRKLFQRDLPPMSQQERIIWSFRMADTNAFL